MLKEDLDDNSSSEIKIKRNFLSYNKKVQTINGEHYSNSDFLKKLNQLIYKTNQDKPSFRQIISKKYKG